MSQWSNQYDKPDTIEYGDYLIQHVKNDACHDYDLPDGQSEAWRVLRYMIMDRVYLVLHQAGSEQAALEWIRKQPDFSEAKEE